MSLKKTEALLFRPAAKEPEKMAQLKQRTQHQRLTCSLVSVVLLATFGTWFPMGYTYVAMNGPQTVIVNWIRSIYCVRSGGVFGQVDNTTNVPGTNLTLWCKIIPEKDEPNMLLENSELNLIWAIGSSFLNVGCLVGAFACTVFAKRFGLKGTHYITAVVFIVGTVILCLAPVVEAYEMLIVGRTVIGLALGFVCVITPVYTSELTPVALRGALGTIPMIMYVLGLMAASALGFPMILGNSWGWPILIAVQMIPLVVLCAGLPFCPDSPRRLFIAMQDKTAAMKALVWLRGTTDVSDELAAMQAEYEAEKGRKTVTLLGFLMDPFLRSTFMLCAVPMFCQQMSGYGGISFYSTSIFTGIGLSRIDSLYVSLGLWATYLTFSLFSMFIVDRAGRRSVILSSHTLMAVFLTLLVILMTLTKHGYSWTKYGSAACIVLYVASFASGSASIPYILPTEMFVQEARTAAMTWVIVVCCVGALIVTLMFPLVVAVLEELTFLIFIASIVLGGAFIYWKLPETKGKSIEHIQKILLDRRR